MKGIIYYTNNAAAENVAFCGRKILRGIGLPIVSVSQYPIDLGKNIVVDFNSSVVSMFQQMVVALENADFEIVFHCEHDVLYHKSHFDFTPPRDDTYYFNTNVWAVDDRTGQALYYDLMKMTSGLCAHRKILLEHYKHKLNWIEQHGKFSQRLMGYEPGRRLSRRKEDYAWDVWKSEHPNVDVKGSHNITRKRFDLSQYNQRRRLEKSWTLANGVPWWGKTKGRFNDFIKDHYDR